MDSDSMLVFILVLLGSLPFYFIFRKTKNASKETREEALRLGLIVEEVSQGASTFSLSSKPLKFKRREHAVRYTLKRRKPQTASWSILQRVESKKIEYPKGWLFVEGVGYPPEIWFLVVESGIAPEPLIDFVNGIASVWTSDYLEFESTPTKVCLYWHEFGGKWEARRAYKCLKRLSRVC